MVDIKMEELKELLNALPDADDDKVLADIPKMMSIIKELGFVKVMEDEDMKDFLPEIQERMTNIDIEKLVPLAKVIMPGFFEGMTELVENSEEATEELEDMEDMRLMISVPELDVHMFMIIEGGKFTGGADKIDNAEMKIEVKKDTFLNLMRGEVDLVSAYMAGGMSMEGPLNKAMQLQSLFEVIADEYDMDIGFF
jgi:putative sterol carrier protein